METSTEYSPRSPRAVKRELRRRARDQTGFDAFISHAHDPDAELAVRIESHLERWARPWYGGRSMRVFRDASKIRASASLREDLIDAMERSRWLVVVLSPSAAESEWVNGEIAHWRSTKESDHVLLVHASGTLEWDDAVGDFAPDSTAVPDQLRGAFADEPRFVDLRPAPSDGWRRRRHRFRTGIRDLATSIHDLPPDLLDGAHRSTVRATRLWAGGVAAFLIASLAFGVLWLGSSRQAAQESERAEVEAARATEEEAVAAANALAARALDMYETDVDIGLLAAVEAWQHRQTPETSAALLAGVVHHRHLEQVLRVEDSPHRVAISPDETLLAVFSLEQRLLVWDLDRHRAVAETQIDTFAEHLAFAPGAEVLALVTPAFDPDAPNIVELRSVADLSTVAHTVKLDRAPSSLVFADDARLLLADGEGVRQIDTTTGTISTLIETPTRSIAVDAAGATLALATGQLVQVWDIGAGATAEGIEEAELEQPIAAVGLSAGGDTVSFATTQSLGVWHRPTQSLTTSIQVIADVTSVVPTEGRLGTTAVRSNGSVVMWEPFAADVVEIDGQTKAATAAPVTGARGLRVAAVGDRLVWVWRTDEPFAIAHPLMHANLMRFEGEPLVRHVDFSPADGSLLVTEAGRLSLWSPHTAELLAETADSPCIAEFSRDGGTVLTVESSSVAGAASLGQRSPELGFSSAGASIEPQDCHLAFDLGVDGTMWAAHAEVIDAATGAVLASGTRATAMDAALADDDGRLVWTSSGTDETGPLVSVLDIATGDSSRYPVGQALWGVAVGPEGEVATGISLGGAEGAIVLWNMEGGEGLVRTGELPRFHAGTAEPAGEDPAVALAFSPHGDHLAAGTLLGSVVVWDVGPEAWVTAACELASRSLTEAEAGGTFSPASLGFAPADACAGIDPSPTSLPVPPPATTTTERPPETDSTQSAAPETTPTTATGDITGFAVAEITLDDEALLVALADTETLRTEVGLRGVADLGDLEGMLFVYPQDVTNGFWMEGALIPLDAAFFDAGGTLVDVFPMELCTTARCPVYFAGSAYRIALLAPMGSLQDLSRDAQLVGAPTPAS